MAKLKVPVTPKDHILGPNDAPVTLIEYGDYQCPACASAYPIVQLVQKYFGEKLRFVYRHFPITELHPLAQSAAQTAEFASSLKKFWQMHDLLYGQDTQLNIKVLYELAEKLHLPTNELKKVFEEKLYLEKIKDDFLGGIYSGVNGTPTFFINDLRYDGTYRYEDLVKAIEEVLVEVE